MYLEGKVAFITGAGRGIGKAIALRFAEEGADLVVTGRNRAALDELKPEIQARGRRLLVLPGDVTDENRVREMVSEAEAEFGHVDVLVNNAGISMEKPLLEMPMDVWDKIIAINLRGTVLCTKAILPGMIARASGTIVNIGSAAGLRGLPGSTAYSASKAAVIAFSQSLGDEIRGKGVRINVLCPGPVDTELFQKSAVRNFIVANHGDIFKPEEVASTALYLASDMSSGMNSQVLTLRGYNRW